MAGPEIKSKILPNILVSFVCNMLIFKESARVATKVLRRFWGRAADTGSKIL